MISVIVPVYNVKNYLWQCVESIIGQTYKDLEIILVDDGSTDGSKELCDKLTEIDERIIVIHKKNEGLSSARNMGLDVSHGEYIGFVDSDDYIEPEMYEKLINSAIDQKADLTICGVSLFNDSGILDSKMPSCGAINREDIFDYAMVSEDWYYVTAWNRLYKKELFEHLRFPKGKNNEDMFIAYPLYDECTKIYGISEPLYMYRQREGSIMNSHNHIKKLDAVEAQYASLKYLYMNHPDYNILRAIDQFLYVYCIRRFHAKPKNVDEKERVSEIDQMFKNVYRKIDKSNEIFLRHPYFFCFNRMIKLKINSVKKRFECSHNGDRANFFL